MVGMFNGDHKSLADHSRHSGKTNGKRNLIIIREDDKADVFINVIGLEALAGYNTQDIIPVLFNVLRQNSNSGFSSDS